MYLPVNTYLQGDKYRIVRFINRGGFGCTYEAEHVMLEKRVAIKEFFVKDFCNRDETTAHVTVGTLSKKGLVTKLKKKFIDEAKGLCKLQHQGIVKVSDVFEENGTAYFVMDYIEGKSLKDMTDEGKLAEHVAVRYIKQVANALGYVHEHNRLHLDIKPGNIMIDGNDNAVLIDFGASKQYDEEAGENTSTLIGKTPGYAPLEQMGNDVVKFMPATDIYALGATLYKLVTGVTPLSATLLAGGETMPPVPATVSEQTRKAIQAAMQIKKSDRPQTVQDFLAILNGGIGQGDDEETEVEVKPVGGNVGKRSGNVEKKSGNVGKKSGNVEKKSENIEKKSENVEKKNNVLKFAIPAIAIIAVGIISYVLISISDNQDYEYVEYVENISYINSFGESFDYTGEVDSDGDPHGQGHGVYEDGVYDGEYWNGLRNGQAVYETTDKTNRFEGVYLDDKYYKGKVTFDDGSYYEGTFQDNSPYTGTWYTKSGTVDGKIENGEYK